MSLLIKVRRRKKIALVTSTGDWLGTRHLLECRCRWDAKRGYCVCEGV